MPTGASRCKAYQYYRKGVIEKLDRSIKEWWYKNSSALGGLTQSEMANHAGVNPSCVTDWWKEEKPIPMDNVGLIDIALRPRYDELNGELAASLRLETNLPSHREAAEAGSRHVLDRLKGADGAVLDLEEYWWLHHLLADNKWAKAMAKKQPGERDQALVLAYDAKKKLVRWHINREPALGLPEVKGLMARWVRIWITG